jgi:hypothetical protein
MSAYFLDQDEGRLHSDAIRSLATDEGFGEEEVGRIYEEVFGEYSRGARVKAFLPILVSRRVRDLLQRRRETALTQVMRREVS